MLCWTLRFSDYCKNDCVCFWVVPFVEGENGAHTMRCFRMTPEGLFIEDYAGVVKRGVREERWWRKESWEIQGLRSQFVPETVWSAQVGIALGAVSVFCWKPIGSNQYAPQSRANSPLSGSVAVIALGWCKHVAPPTCLCQWLQATPFAYSHISFSVASLALVYENLHFCISSWFSFAWRKVLMKIC